jgi:hypothetical protein
MVIVVACRVSEYVRMPGHVSDLIGGNFGGDGRMKGWLAPLERAADAVEKQGPASTPSSWLGSGVSLAQGLVLLGTRCASALLLKDRSGR